MAYNLPTIRTVEDIEREFPDTIIIASLDTYEEFDNFYYKLYYAICACFEIDECVKHMIQFKFYKTDDEVFSLPLTKLLLNLNAWRPLIELNSLRQYYDNHIEILNESFIIGTMFSDTLRIGLESKVLKVLNSHGINFERTSMLLKTVIERYQEISVEFSLITNHSIMTLESVFLNDYRNNEKIRDLNNLNIPQSMQTSDVEKLLNEKTKELIYELGNTRNPVWYVSKAGNHIKPKQVQELFLSYGQIPDVSGNVIPYTMKGNGFATGYVDPTTYYIAATGARLALIMNKVHMGDAGYLSRNLILASRTLSLSRTMFDCGTKHLLKVNVTNSTFLHRLENKWFSYSEFGPLELIHYDTHKHLIGKTIYVRSLITCAGGDEVCHVCYGKDSHLVMNMPGMAIFNTEVYSEPVSQNILSTKHLLFTAAMKLVFGDNFHKYLKFSAGDIYVKDIDELPSTIKFDKIFIRIPVDNITPVNSYDSIENSTFGNTIDSPIYVYNASDNNYIKVTIDNSEGMFIDPQSMKSFKFVKDPKSGNKYYEIAFADAYSELDGRIMSVDIKNNGLTDNLYLIMRLLNRNANKYDDYNVIAQEFFETLINAGIKCRNVQGEVILNRLVRSMDTPSTRPNFKEFKLPEYKILNLNQALLTYDAPTIGMSYQEMQRQILSNDLYEVKKGSSYLDPLYSTQVSTERLKLLMNKRREKQLQQSGGIKNE